MLITPVSVAQENQSDGNKPHKVQLVQAISSTKQIFTRRNKKVIG